MSTTPVAPDHRNPNLASHRFASIQFAADANTQWRPELWTYWYVLLNHDDSWIFIRYEDGHPYYVDKSRSPTFEEACEAHWGGMPKYRVLSPRFAPARLENIPLTNDEKEASIREFLELNKSDTSKNDQNVNESLLRRYPGASLETMISILDRSLIPTPV